MSCTRCEYAKHFVMTLCMLTFTASYTRPGSPSATAWASSRERIDSCISMIESASVWSPRNGSDGGVPFPFFFG